MNIRSTSELSQYLGDELKWRIHELRTIKLMSSRARQHEQTILIRLAVCLLYAHWEGFIKHAGRAYLNFLSKQGLKYGDVVPSIISFCMSAKFREIGETKKYTLMSETVELLVGDNRDSLFVPWDVLMSDQSNLTAAAFREIAHVINIEYRPYATKEKLIDQRLLANRHAIAHGERILMDWTDYEELHNQMVGLIEQFRDDVENAAVLRKYRRPAPALTGQVRV